MITLGYSRQSRPSARRIEEASHGEIRAVRSSDCDINWGRNHAPHATLNADTSRASNKRLMREAFHEHGVPSPRLYTPAEAYELFDEIGTTSALLGRPDRHTRRQGMWLATNTDEVNAAIAGSRYNPAATHFLELINKERAPKEFRVHIFNGKSIRVSEKQHDDDGKYVTVRPDPDLPRRFIRAAAKAAVEAVGLDFGTVDVLASHDQRTVWVLEVNTAAGLGGSMPALWASTFINYIAERQ